MSNSCPENLPMFDKHTTGAQNQPLELSRPQSNCMQQADTDEMLIEMWLHGRSPNTQQSYRRDIELFLKYVDKPIRQIRLSDLQAFSDALFQKDLATSSIKRTLWAIKSMFSFATKINYTQYNVGIPLRLPVTKDCLSERILSEDEVHTIIESITNDRDRLIVKTLYYTGLRVSELVRLKWKDFQYRTEGGLITYIGKGGKTNTIILPQHLWDALMLHRDTIDENAPVFRSKKRGHICVGHVRRLVKKYGIKAIGKGATPHFYRHSHASHALDNGCPIHLVQKQLNHSSISTTGKYLHARPTESSSKYLK